MASNVMKEMMRKSKYDLRARREFQVYSIKLISEQNL